MLTCWQAEAVDIIEKRRALYHEYRASCTHVALPMAPSSLLVKYDQLKALEMVALTTELLIPGHSRMQVSFICDPELLWLYSLFRCAYRDNSGDEIFLHASTPSPGDFGLFEGVALI